MALATSLCLTLNFPSRIWPGQSVPWGTIVGPSFIPALGLQSSTPKMFSGRIVQAWVKQRGQARPPWTQKLGLRTFVFPHRAALLWCWVGLRRPGSCWNIGSTTSSSQVRFGVAPASRPLGKTDSHVHSYQSPPQPQPMPSSYCTRP